LPEKVLTHVRPASIKRPSVAADWRERHPALAAWYARMRARPSFAQTLPEDKA
jgi:glutathione S-transferase